MMTKKIIIMRVKIKKKVTMMIMTMTMLEDDDSHPNGSISTFSSNLVSSQRKGSRSSSLNRREVNL